MTPQAYKDEVQPAEKTPADVEKTKDAFQNPPQQKKPIAHKVSFTLAFVCFGVALLSFTMANWYHPDTGTYEENLIIIFTLGFLLPLFASIIGVFLLIIGAAFYPTNRKSR
jgi:hypothetical protein